jgi:hypothetical protein
MSKPWEQLEGESDAWYGKFERYYLMQGEGRALVEAENRYRDDKGRERQSYTSGAWARASDEYRWKERAQAYDRAQRSKLRDRTEDARQDAIAQLVDAAPEVAARLMRIALGEDKASKVELSAINSVLARAGVPELRATDVSVSGSVSVEKEMSDEELLDRLRQLRELAEDYE